MFTLKLNVVEKQGRKMVLTGQQVSKVCENSGEARSFMGIVQRGQLDLQKAAKSKTITIHEPASVKQLRR